MADASYPIQYADGLPTPRRYYAAITVMAGIGLSTLSSSIVNVALPSMSQAFNVTEARTVLIVTLFNLISVMLLLPCANIAQRIGYKRFFVSGLIFFSASSTVCALAPNFEILLAARAVQAIGAAIIMSMFAGFVKLIHPAKRLGFGISLNASTVALMLVLGPTLGAIILSYSSWKWLFLAPLPLCLITLWGTRYLPDIPTQKRPLDLISMLVCMACLGLFLVGMNRLATEVGQGLLMIALAVVFAMYLVYRSRDQDAPVVPVDLLKQPSTAFAILASISTFASQTVAFTALPFLFEDDMQLPVIEVGVLLAASPLGTGAIALVAGYLSDKYSPALLSGIGAGLMALGASILCVLPAGLSHVWYMSLLFMAGVGFGLFQTPNNRSIIASAPKERGGAVGALQATSRVFGQSIGATLVALVFAWTDLYSNRIALGLSVVCALIAIGINLLRSKQLTNPRI